MTTKGDDGAPVDARRAGLEAPVFRVVELVDTLPKTPKEKEYRLRTRGVEGVWDREAAGDRLTR